MEHPKGCPAGNHVLRSGAQTELGPQAAAEATLLLLYKRATDEAPVWYQTGRSAGRSPATDCTPSSDVFYAWSRLQRVAAQSPLSAIPAPSAKCQASRTVPQPPLDFLGFVGPGSPANVI